MKTYAHFVSAHVTDPSLSEICSDKMCRHLNVWPHEGFQNDPFAQCEQEKKELMSDILWESLLRNKVENRTDTK